MTASGDHPVANTTPPAPRVVTDAALLLIGTELLTGKIQEKNLKVLATTLRGVGISLVRALVVLDDPKTIAESVRELSRDHDVVFTSGGVGPTHDDLTVASVAAGFGVPTVESAVIRQLMESHYGDRLTPEHLLMAQVPKGAELLVAPGMPWPAVVKKNVWLLPGIPVIFAAKMAVVQAHLIGPGSFFGRSVYLKLDEAMLLRRLEKVVKDHPDVEVGSYPRFRDSHYDTKITFDGDDEAKVVAAREALLLLVDAKDVVSVDDVPDAIR